MSEAEPVKKVLVIIPTYNEVGNVKDLTAAIFDVFKKLPNRSVEVLIVDDNSPDGTGKMVEAMQKTNRKVHLLSGQKAGLGKACLRGLKKALQMKSFDALVMMDGDFSHNPQAMVALLDNLAEGHDYVIGSRYVTGGGTKNWPLRRKINSWAANLFARTLLDMRHDVRDLTGGYKAIRISALKQIDLDNIRTAGYVFHVNLLHEFSKQDFRIREVPIVFTERKHGSSKMRLSDVLEFIYLAYRLNPNSRPRRIIRFGLVGASGTLVNLAVLIVLVHAAGLSAILSDALAIEASIISNFFLNHYYTFGAAYTSPKNPRQDPVGSVLLKLAKYNLITLGGAGISFLIFLLVYKELHWHYVAADLIGIVLAMSWNYWLSTKLVWKIIDD